MTIALCFALPLVGTAAGAALVFLCACAPSPLFSRITDGFAAGVMGAAALFSLLLPAIESCAAMGRAAFLPPAAGFLFGAGSMAAADRFFPLPEDGSGRWRRLFFAVTVHNLPEGMAVGVVAAGWAAGTPGITAASCLALAAGIAAQNLPEGAVISLPARASGAGKCRAFLFGVLSGVVEPAGAATVFLFAPALLPLMPYLLAFAAGAMLFVTARELCPSFAAARSHEGDLAFAAGFVLMMALDVAT